MKALLDRVRGGVANGDHTYFTSDIDRLLRLWKTPLTRRRVINAFS